MLLNQFGCSPDHPAFVQIEQPFLPGLGNIAPYILALTLLMPGPHSSISSDDTCPERVCRVVAYLLTEILELASYRALDSSHFQIVQSDIRHSVYTDGDLFRFFQYSKAFWQGVE